MTERTWEVEEARRLTMLELEHLTEKERQALPEDVQAWYDQGMYRLKRLKMTEKEMIRLARLSRQSSTRR
jgi:hypothetical protein